MEPIKNKLDFLKLIATEEQHIIFCYHGWSGYSIIAKKIVEDWESRFQRSVSFIDATKMEHKNYLMEWLISKEKRDWSKQGIMTFNRFTPRNRIHGYGEICWVKNRLVRR